MKKWYLKPPTYEDFSRLLMAWRVWFGGALVGALLATALYFIVPPPYRAQATVLVDQNVEQVIPQEQTDLRKYTYLQRETDKLWEIAWADQTLARLSAETGIPVADLRDGRLKLSQPSDGGWHFIADSPDPQIASALASAWAKAFYDEVMTHPAGISSILEVNLTQESNLPVGRAVPLGLYVFSGALIGVALFSLGLLLFGHSGA